MMDDALPVLPCVLPESKHTGRPSCITGIICQRIGSGTTMRSTHPSEVDSLAMTNEDQSSAVTVDVSPSFNWRDHLTKTIHLQKIEGVASPFMIPMLRLLFWGAVMLSIFIFSLWFNTS